MEGDMEDNSSIRVSSTSSEINDAVLFGGDSVSVGADNITAENVELSSVSDNSNFKVPILPGSTLSPSPLHANKIFPNNPTIGDDLPTNDKIKPEKCQYGETECSPKNRDKAVLSPAQEIKQSPVPYQEPSWGGITDKKFSFEVLKNGVLYRRGCIIDNIDLTQKSYFVFGRLPSCDITMEHPSLSRYHAVVQYCNDPTESFEKGWYLYDLDSTHGTWINKNRVPPNRFHRIRVGHVVKLGGSTRLNILQGPDDDRDEESELTISEMKEQRERQKREAEVLKQADLAEDSKLQQMKTKEDSSGCTWGIDEEDAYDITENNPFAALNPENEELYLDDPKKTLKGYFEREGYEQPEYTVSDEGSGKFRCRVELPIDTPSGQPIYAEVVVSGKKREAVVACALEGCRIIDRHGLLRASKHESHKRKKKNWEEDDFYESDEDTFLDRTGTIEKKREMRMHKSSQKGVKAETHDSLVEKHKSLLSEIAEIEAKLDKAKKDAEAVQAEDVDALDAYMMSIKSGSMDTKTKMKLKGQLLQLRQSEIKLRKLVQIAKPTAMPDLKKNPTDQRKSLPMFGKMKGVHRSVKKPVPEKPIGELLITDENDIVEEEEEDDEIADKNNVKTDIGSTNIGTKVFNRTKDSQQSSMCSEQKAQVFEKLQKNVSSDSNFPSSPKNIEKGKSNTFTTEPQEKEFPSSLLRSDSELQNPTVPMKKQPQKDKKVYKKFKPDQKPLNYGDSDPDYAVWLPPKDQAGDGKTHLNAKYGY
ncbi:hypothetical protein ScPMuIL_014728 [Solemya velum]